MKNKEGIFRWSILFFVMTIVLALLSWVGNLMGWEPVQSLLSEEGIRWELNHVISDYVQAPALGIMLLVFMGVGIGIRGGFYETFRRMFCRGRALSAKERRSLMLSLVVGVAYVLMVFLSVPFLKSVTDSFFHSPFQNGFFYILSFGIGLMSLVYGYASNRFRNLGQVVDAMSYLISAEASYFVTLFFVVQFFSVLNYTCFSAWLGINDTIINILFQVCCYLPIFSSFLKRTGQ